MLLPLQMEEGVLSREMQVASRSWKRQGMDSPLELPEGAQTSCRLDFGLIRLMWDSDFQPCDIINLCCVKPLSLWWFIMAAAEDSFITSSHSHPQEESGLDQKTFQFLNATSKSQLFLLSQTPHPHPDVTPILFLLPKFLSISTAPVLDQTTTTLFSLLDQPHFLPVSPPMTTSCATPTLHSTSVVKHQPAHYSLPEPP